MRNAAMATSSTCRCAWKLAAGERRRKISRVALQPSSVRQRQPLPPWDPTEHLDGDPPSKGSITLAQGSAMLS